MKSFGLLQTCGSIYTSWISLTCLCSVFLSWNGVDCWSYHYSNNNMDWQQARTWCQTHHTDMVAIQNQEEIAHLNDWLPFKPGYYWIGIRKVDDVWTWVGTNKSLTEEATNWAAGEPNNANNGMLADSEDCVEMYIKSTGTNNAGKWNDERCVKQKTALCYSAACKNDSCLYGDCVETINSYRCACFEGFYGEKCEHVVNCNKDEVTVPDNGSVKCTHKHGEFFYDSVCQYSCEEGYELSMPRPLKCTAAKTWSDQPPRCELVQCPELSHPEWGSMSCSDPLGPSSYQSTCVFQCEEGYELSGSDTLSCGAEGNWDASQPSCVAVQCPALPEREDVIVTCGDDVNMMFSFGNSCSFSCALGFTLAGANTTTCTSSAEWSNSMPDCEAVQCPALEEPENGFVNCGENTDTKFSYENVCSFSCSPGYNLEGANKVTCTSAAVWTDTIPSCKAVQCPAIPKLENLIVTCGDDANTRFSFGNTCSFSCAPGYNLVGAKAVTCTSSTEWSETFPHCEAITCPVPEQQPNQIMECSSQSELRQNSTCTFICQPGFLLQGAQTLHCTAEGQWNAATPTCEAVICPFLEAPQNGHINCSLREPVYSSQCSFTCDQDYTLEGQALLICSHHGNWTEDTPTCNAAAEAGASQTPIVASGLAAGGAVLLSGLSLALWVLKRIKSKASKFELSSNSDIEVPPQTYRNSIDSLI